MINLTASCSQYARLVSVPRQRFDRPVVEIDHVLMPRDGIPDAEDNERVQFQENVQLCAGLHLIVERRESVEAAK